MNDKALTVQAYGWLTDDEDARVCKDIPDSACNDQPRNYFIHLGSLVLTKTGDKFADPKIVLAWLMSALGAPAFFVGLLVPVRESLSLLPQLAVAAAIRRMAVRKWLWCAGSLGQALSLIGVGVAALSLQGAAAGATIIGLLAVFSLSRGVCSVTHKDVVGKTISKDKTRQRQRLCGLAGRRRHDFSGALAHLWRRAFHRRHCIHAVCAAAMWAAAAGLYAMLAEQPGATEGGGNALEEAMSQLRLLQTDRNLRDFIIARTFLLGSALVTPYFVMLAQESGAGLLASFGGLLLAASIASFLSSPFWGRFSDVSSRRVMAAGGAMAGVTGVALAVLVGAGATNNLIFAAAIFLIYVAHAGVRTGRKTHIVDIATAETRASYVPFPTPSSARPSSPRPPLAGSPASSAPSAPSSFSLPWPLPARAGRSPSKKCRTAERGANFHCDFRCENPIPKLGSGVKRPH